MMSTLKVAVVIPTYNGRNDLARLLDSLERQSAPFDTLIVDSSSSDGTWELAQERCANVLRIDSKDFNHGGTRQLMVQRHPDYDVYVFMTQDAYLADSQGIAAIVRPFADARVGAVCGRQLPHLNATPLAEHARRFNYPPESQVKSLEDAPTLGIKTAFMSNSFAAYRREALMQVGGFPVHVILSEDMYVTAKMLIAGWKIAYEGQACAHHSHNYSLKEEFRRYFDIGVFHGREPWIRQTFGGAGGEGLRYVKSELAFLGPGRVLQWPGSLLRNAVKLVAYKLSQQERFLPLGLKKNLGMYRRYWDSPYA